MRKRILTQAPAKNAVGFLAPSENLSTEKIEWVPLNTNKNREVQL